MGCREHGLYIMCTLQHHISLHLAMPRISSIWAEKKTNTHSPSCPLFLLALEVVVQRRFRISQSMIFFFFFFYWAEGLPSPNDCKPRLAGIDPSPYPPLWVKSTRSVGKLNHVVRMPAVRLIIPRQPETLQNPTTNKKREEKKDTERWYSWHVPITLGNF